MKKTRIEPAQRIARGNRTASRIIHGKAVIMFLGTKIIEPAGASFLPHVNDERIEDRWYRLDEEATCIWRLLKRAPTLEKLIVRYARMTGIDRGRAAKKVGPFIEQLRRNEFVDIL